jgi:ATP-dependent RNA helicase RhlE
MQIHSDFETLGRFTRVTATTVFGGVSMSRQVRALRAQPDIVVACPGRLLDLYEQRLLDLDGIETVVIDEADNMFDMGFLPDVRRILAAIPRDRQTLLFSATMPKEIRQLADGILRQPKVVELNHTQPLATIEHELYPVPQVKKFELLELLMADKGFTSAIVFMRTKHRALRVAQQLARNGHSAVALQGNMSQAQRDRAMQGFREGRFNVLVATDIAARGLDIAHVSHVINFDMPGTPEAYTHRIGRTGRAERSGKAYTFITNEDAAAVRTLEKQLGKTIQRCHIQGFEDTGVPAPAPAQRNGRYPKPHSPAPQKFRSPKRHAPQPKSAERRPVEQGSPERRFTDRKSYTPAAAPAAARTGTRPGARPPTRTRRFSGAPRGVSRPRR